MRHRLRVYLLCAAPVVGAGCRNLPAECRLDVPERNADDAAMHFGDLLGTTAPGSEVELTAWPGAYWGQGARTFCEPLGTAAAAADGSWRLRSWSEEGLDRDRAIAPGPYRLRVDDGGDVRFAHRWVALDEDCEGRRCETWDVPAAPDGEWLPDVVVDPSTLTDCRIIETPLLRQLHVSVGTANIGHGPLEVRSVLADQVVRQVVHHADGGTAEELLPDAQFVWADHEDHDHFHLEGWTRLRLLDTDGVAEVTSGRKVSFCIADSDRFDGEMNRELGWDAEPYDCDRVGGEIRQGISPGMEDIYTKETEGQSLDIAGLAPGTYTLEVTVDPDGLIREGRVDNNTVRARVEIPEDDAGGRGICFLDAE